MLERIFNFAFAVALIAGFMSLVRYTEKPWPLIEGQRLVDQVGACQFINLNTGVENYLQALKVLGIRPDLETAVDLAINGPPSFGRRYNCFANISENEKKAVIATQQYRDIQYEIAKRINSLSSHFR